MRKIEAEVIAFVVAQTIGLSAGRARRAVLENSQILKGESRSHTFPVRIVQCEIGTHIVARLVLGREEGKVFK